MMLYRIILREYAILKTLVSKDQILEIVLFELAYYKKYHKYFLAV